MCFGVLVVLKQVLIKCAWASPLEYSKHIHFSLFSIAIVKKKKKKE